MEKKKVSKSPFEGEGFKELVVIVNPDAGLLATPDAVSSTKGKKVSSINTLLKEYKAIMNPIFGSEARLANLTPNTVSTMNNSGINPGTYYSLTTTKNIDNLQKAMLNEGFVDNVYIKPPSEPPMRFDQDIDMSSVHTADTPPTTPNFVARQGYLNAAPGGIDAIWAWQFSGAKGNGINIIDIEGAWRFTHEDLIVNQGGVIGGTQLTHLAWRNHGTAVVGEFGGDENNIGIKGICPNANVRAISFGGIGTAKAIKDAADALNPGDIILIELHRPGPRNNFQSRNDQHGYIAIEWWPDDFAAILYATSKGVIVVEAAGNGAQDFDDAIYSNRPINFPNTWTNPFNMNNPQSGAVIVGAGAPPPGTHGRNHGPDRSRLDFSNYGSRLDTQGWGREVTTCGYKDLQDGPDEDFWYTDIFSGTSSASPIIVGALGSTQGRLKARGKTLLTPATAINLLRTTGSSQQDAPGRPTTQRIGTRPNLKSIFNTLKIGYYIKVKEQKDSLKEWVKEKDFKESEHKHQLKDRIKDSLKEYMKEEIKEKEFKEFKEKDKDRYEFDYDFRLKNRGYPSADPESDVHSRLSNIEEKFSQLMHFIAPELRPDLHSPLYEQSDLDMQQKMQDESEQSKISKDNKDIETNF